MDDRKAMTLIEVLVTIAIIGILLAVTVPAVQMMRASAAKAECQNNLRQLGLGLTQFHDMQRKFPPGTGSQNDAYPFLNWPARILPYLEQVALWQAIEAAYSRQPDFLQPGHEGRTTVVSLFLCPAGGRSNFADSTDGPAFSYYLGVLGVDSTRRDGMLFVDSAIRQANVSDGTSNTIFVGERPPSPDGVYGWWYAGWGQNKDGVLETVVGVRELNRPQHWWADPNDRQCPPGPYTFRNGVADNHCDTFHYWSLHRGGAHFLFVDGSVRFLSYDFNEAMVALATRASGESIPGLPQ